MTVQTRKPKINSTKVYPLNFGEWTHYEVQGTDGFYHVHIPVRPLKGEYFGQVYYEYRPTCYSKAGPKRFSTCKENSNGATCDHCLAAIKHRVGQRDKVLSLPENGEFASAIKLLNFGGQLVKIVNQNGKAIWGMAR